jgi:nucleosome-remodeling factor subunit
MPYSVIERGSPFTLDYKVYLADESGFISPFHDIPLYANAEKTVLNMVVEVPRWTNAKMEISKDDKLNPIKQDVKKEKLRFVDNCFPHHGYIWNYGALPQTYEDPSIIDEHTQQKGDNDPIDVCEIGFKVRNRGDVVQVKVLGIMALIDEGETDWKVIAIDVNDPLANELNDIDDVETHMPGFLMATNEWFRIYKIPTGKPENQFAFNGEAKNKAFANAIIEQAHGQWRNLIARDGKSPSRVNTTVTGNKFIISQEEAKAIVDAAPIKGEPAQIPQEVNKWHFVKL